MARRIMTHEYHPVALRLKGRPAVVIGGGTVSERKTLSLLQSGAKVRVVSPRLTNLLQYLSETKAISWRKGLVREKDLSGASIVIAATNNKDQNSKISSWAGKQNIPVNVVDQPGLSTFISPAVLRFKKAIISVYTDGKDPLLSRDLKNFLKENLDGFLSYRDRLQKR